MFTYIYLFIASVSLGVLGTLIYFTHKEIQEGPERLAAKHLVKDIPKGYTPVVLLAFSRETNQFYTATVLSEDMLIFALSEVLAAKEERIKKEEEGE